MVLETPPGTSATDNTSALDSSYLTTLTSSTGTAHGDGQRSHSHTRTRRSRRILVSEDTACEVAASKLFRRLDRHGNGQVEERQVVPLWPELSRHMEGTTASVLATRISQRSNPINREEWMSLMNAIRSVVGPRLFRSSLRAAQEHLEHHPRSPSPKSPKGRKGVTSAQDFFLPGAVDHASTVEGSIVDNSTLKVQRWTAPSAEQQSGENAVSGMNAASFFDPVHASPTEALHEMLKNIGTGEQYSAEIEGEEEKQPEQAQVPEVRLSPRPTRLSLVAEPPSPRAPSDISLDSSEEDDNMEFVYYAGKLVARPKQEKKITRETSTPRLGREASAADLHPGLNILAQTPTGIRISLLVPNDGSENDEQKQAVQDLQAKEAEIEEARLASQRAQEEHERLAAEAEAQAEKAKRAAEIAEAEQKQAEEARKALAALEVAKKEKEDEDARIEALLMAAQQKQEMEEAEMAQRAEEIARLEKEAANDAGKAAELAEAKRQQELEEAECARRAEEIAKMQKEAEEAHEAAFLAEAQERQKMEEAQKAREAAELAEAMRPPLDQPPVLEETMERAPPKSKGWKKLVKNAEEDGAARPKPVPEKEVRQPPPPKKKPMRSSATQTQSEDERQEAEEKMKSKMKRAGGLIKPDFISDKKAQKNEKQKDEKASTAPAKSASSKEGVKLPALTPSRSAPGTLQTVEASEHEALVSKLRDELSLERVERERMSERVKDLERRLRQAASKPRYGITKPTPYKTVPLPPPPPSSPKQIAQTRGLQLPALRTIPHSPSPQRWLDEQAVAASAQSDMEASRSPEASRADRSKARVEAIKKLEGKGLNNWKERRTEKVARLQDLTVFRDSMWGSFFEWHEDYNLT